MGRILQDPLGMMWTTGPQWGDVDRRIQDPQWDDVDRRIKGPHGMMLTGEYRAPM